MPFCILLEKRVLTDVIIVFNRLYLKALFNSFFFFFLVTRVSLCTHIFRSIGSVVLYSLAADILVRELGFLWRKASLRGSLRSMTLQSWAATRAVGIKQQQFTFFLALLHLHWFPSGTSRMEIEKLTLSVFPDGPSPSPVSVLPDQHIPVEPTGKKGLIRLDFHIWE